MKLFSFFLSSCLSSYPCQISEGHSGQWYLFLIIDVRGGVSSCRRGPVDLELNPWGHSNAKAINNLFSSALILVFKTHNVTI